MKFSALSENVISAAYKHGGEVVNLEINIDALTPDYFRQLEAKAKVVVKPKPKRGKNAKPPGVFDDEIRYLEVDRELHADALYPHVLKAWDLTEDDGETPVRLNKESLMRLPPKLIQDLYSFCIEQSKTVKKRHDAGGTLESTRDGSQGLHVVGQAS